MAMELDERCAVVALTHDPKLDDLALMEALKSPAFYVGALGSRANNAKRRERLREFDLTDDEIARLHGPIGLYIGSRTPPEIAVSILAEITARKNGVDPRRIASVAVAKAEIARRPRAAPHERRRAVTRTSMRAGRSQGSKSPSASVDGGRLAYVADRGAVQ